MHGSAFFSRIVACGLARICGYATKKGNRFSDIFLRKSNRQNARHCYTVASEGTRPQGRGVPKIQKKGSRVSRLDCLSQNFCHELFPNYALPVTTKPADAYTYNYEEHQGYTDVQGYAVEPRHVTFGGELHKHLFVLIDGVGGCNCSIAPNGTKVFYRPTSSPSLIGRGVITIRGVRAGDANNGAVMNNNAVTDKSVTDNNAVVARHADERCNGLAACKQQETNR